MRRAFHEAAEVVAFLFFMFWALALLPRCTPHEQLTVENAAAVAQYDKLLVEECKARARAARSLEAFDECELEVRKAFCASSEALRKEWPRCAEVTP